MNGGPRVWKRASTKLDALSSRSVKTAQAEAKLSQAVHFDRRSEFVSEWKLILNRRSRLVR